VRLLGRVLGIACGFAAGGIFLGHSIGYHLVAPDPSVRHELLLSTGHGYFDHATILGMAGMALAAAIVVGLGYRKTVAGGAIRLPSASHLAVLQVGGFLVLETTERVLSAAPLGDLAGVLIAGIPVQIAVAAVASALIRLLDALGEKIARALASVPHVGGEAFPTHYLVGLPGLAPATSLPVGSRAPPAPRFI
jgi:hypothetical protein